MLGDLSGMSFLLLFLTRLFYVCPCIPNNRLFPPNRCIETVAMFAQCVYLMFLPVYVCKETVEHQLLLAGSGEGHHHHGDEEPTMLRVSMCP